MKAAAAAVFAMLGLAGTTFAVLAAPAAKAPRVTSCTAFMDGFVRAAAGRKATFERPLNITRGFMGDEGGLDVRVLATGGDVEGTLKCKGDAFRRFEVRVDTPADDQVITAFGDYQMAALSAAFGWDRAKVQTIVGAMSSDAAEYLRASHQRGDTYVAGKVEYHQGDALDLGVIWTDEDRMLVVTAQNDE